MTRRRWIYLTVGIALAALFVVWMAMPISQHDSKAHSLSYSVVPRKGHLRITVSDNRSGKHSVWAVLLDPPKGSHRELMGTFRDGSQEGTQSVTNDALLPAGTCSYALYQANGIIYPGGSRY